MDNNGQAIHLDTDMPRTSVGGPLVDEDGYVLGVLSTSGAAIPVDVARAAALDIVGGS